MAGTKGKSGRRKKPAAAKKANGTYRKERDADPLNMAGEVPPIPKDLHKKAAAEWKRLAPICARVGILKPVDWLAWEMGMRALSTFYEVREQVGEFIHVTDKGYPVARPEAAISRQAMAAVLQFCREFGLTPSARSGLTLDDEFDPPGNSGGDADPIEKHI